MKVELLDVLKRIQRTAESHDRTAEFYKEEGFSNNYLEFSARASSLRIMANGLETIYSIKKEHGELTE